MEIIDLELKSYRADTIFKVKVEWPWRYRSRSNVITCDTPSHASDHLYQIWKESIKNCWCYGADMIFKAKAKWPWRYRSRSKVIICNTPSHTRDHLCYIWKESVENCMFCFQRQGRKISKICQKFKFSDSEKNVSRDTPPNDSDHLCQISKETIQICRRYRADTIFSVKVEWPWRYRSRSKVIGLRHTLLW